MRSELVERLHQQRLGQRAKHLRAVAEIDCQCPLRRRVDRQLHGHALNPLDEFRVGFELRFIATQRTRLLQRFAQAMRLR